jgi:endonuclease III
MKHKSNEIDKVYEILKHEFQKHRMPVVDLIETQTKDPFKVLLTTIMSARTKDETTILAAKRLFQRVSTPADLDSLSVKEIESLIFPVGFYREKAKNLKKLPQVLNDLFAGQIPSTVEELVQLPGVGRKTANLVVAVAFNKPAVCVDTHVHRIFNRLGYLKTSTPLETEMKLREWLPVKYWTTFNSYFVSFGQHICRPINPYCDRCPVYDYCSRIDVVSTYLRGNSSSSR